MQTFVPLESFTESAKVLDRQRLGKQRPEVLQILKALTGEGGWQNHPATRMWAGHEYQLIMYGVSICDEWTDRGYEDTCRDKILDYLSKFDKSELPSWWGGQIHSTHRSKLLSKNPDHYSKFGWTDDPSAEYFWPKPKGNQ